MRFAPKVLNVRDSVEVQVALRVRKQIPDLKTIDDTFVHPTGDESVLIGLCQTTAIVDVAKHALEAGDR